jgi:hypothetical protein
VHLMKIMEGSGRHTPLSRLPHNHHHASSSNQFQIQGVSFRTLRFESSSSTSAKARNGVIRVFDLDRSLSPLRLMQKTSSASLLIAECEAGQEGNERPLLQDSALAIVVDFEHRRISETRSSFAFFFHPKHVPRLHNYIHRAKIPFQYQLTHTCILDE